MRRELTDTEQFLQSMVDHPVGTSYIGRHWSEPEPTPLEIAQESRTFRVVEYIFGALAVAAMMIIVYMVFRALFLVVMSLW
ncbi:hypothetical protein [Corynebacterium kalidii]|uniref:Uncharacterized protein n=1 Tax=Corynebacterium kalidii TaxID=2931982 RepID=A0A9X1WHG4_9CORY|nr:hypothetical protein [Corynebacterium kalidii]MCJ7859234.1 hypothetical protein [Corynebacterium kalidii]